MRSENPVGLEMFSLPQQVEIHLTKSRGEGIRVRIGKASPVGKSCLDSVALRRSGEAGWSRRLEQSLRMHLGER